MKEVFPPFQWDSLEQAELWGTGVRIRRSEIAFLKHIVESYEGLGFTRMVSSKGPLDATVAVIGPADSVAGLSALLRSLQSPSFPLEPCPLPDVCRDHWFHDEWS